METKYPNYIHETSFYNELGFNPVNNKRLTMISEIENGEVKPIRFVVFQQEYDESCSVEIFSTYKEALDYFYLKD